MIHSFSCKNFYSFEDLTSLSFVVNENAPQNNSYFETKLGDRLSKVETLIGPNASGKTNLLKVLPFLKFLIVDSYDLKPEEEILVEPFLLNNGKDKPIELSVTYEIEGRIFIHSFSLSKKKITFEELKLKSKTKEKVTTKKLFSRVWDEEKGQYAFTANKFGTLPKGFEGFLRKNTSVIGSAVRSNHPESKAITDFWQSIEPNVSAGGWIGGHLIASRPRELLDAATFYTENENLKIQAEKLLSRFDLGIKGFSIKKEKKEGGGVTYQIKFQHLFNDHIFDLPLHSESSGTMQLFILLKSILAALASGSIAILDEFDVNLHPEITNALFDLFIQPETNEKNAQLLFCTHNHLILNKLDKYQINLVQKTDSGCSEAWRLDEVSGVRVDDNFESKYLAGAYGAYPKM
jgi:AAA15 family ATPase/GTPase